MIAVPLLDAHTGCHCKQPSLLARIFRAVLRGPGRKQAAPAVSAPAGAATLAGVRMSYAMDTGEFAALDVKVDALRRPVNGRSLGTQPRRQPVPDAVRERYDGPPVSVLERVRDGLLKLDGPRQLTYGETCVADALAAEQEERLAS